MIKLANPNTKSVLDVGCLDGACLATLAGDGWDVEGFDVNPDIPEFVQEQFGISRDRIQVGSEFHFSGKQYGAVISREVLEHVPDHKSHFSELAKSVMPGGVLMMQTPRPCDDPKNSIVYQTLHLQILSVEALLGMFADHGFSIEYEQSWDSGQLFIGRKPC